MPNQITIDGAGFPGEANSYYSDEKSLAVSTRAVVPEVGFIMVVAVSGVSYTLQTADDSPPTYVTVLAANTTGMVWSDGVNLYATATSATARYFVLGYKP